MKRRDFDIAAEIEETMRRDYWRHWTRAEIAKRVGCTPDRALRVLRNDRRFREYCPDKTQRYAEFGLWN